MPRYYFHMSVGAHCCWDTAGLDQPNLAAAYRHALRLTYRVLRGVVRLDTRERWAIRVCSTDGDPELVVLFPTEDARHAHILPDTRAAVPPRTHNVSRDVGRCR